MSRRKLEITIDRPPKWLDDKSKYWEAGHLTTLKHERLDRMRQAFRFRSLAVYP
jgi:hypothetical protein